MLVLLVLFNLVVLSLLILGLYRVSTQLPTMVSPLPTAGVVDPPVAPTPGPTATPLGRGGAIAFTLHRDGNTDLYALNQRDQTLVRLTSDPSVERQPAWSPDGDYIAFASGRADNWDIYLLDLISGRSIRLTHGIGFDANPSWSPDGQWIAFESYRNGNLDIYVMSTSGQDVQRVTTDRAPDYAPTWSPDSQSIAFTSFRDGNKDIFLRFLDEQAEAINLTQSPDTDENDPAWSPDGTRLAYTSGPSSNPSIQVMLFDWETRAVDYAQTELFGAGTAPAWSPDGQTLIYTYERSERSHLVAASITGWALFQEVYSLEGALQDLDWSPKPLSPRVVARTEVEPLDTPPLYVELTQPTPSAGPPYELVPLPTTEDEETLLSDRVNESFNALRQRVVEEAGWDYLGTLASAWRPITYTPPSGHSRMSWHLCGRAFALEQDAYENTPQRVELVREDVGNVIYWRLFIRAAEQDGAMGEPLREAPWDLNAREDGGRAMVEGGELKSRIPSGYYIDFTTLAEDYGWERVPAMWRWRYFWPDVRWWEFQKMGELTWWDCMLEVHDPDRIEHSFGPIPGYEE
jgi:TolB protein